ncbi:hypothetical protein EDC04DRAFT_2605900 [Pisolithus marmoratus]|nr:hypothetical protein EDC04DRAFT_2605900 [Pisolithus marmoratus]
MSLIVKLRNQVITLDPSHRCNFETSAIPQFLSALVGSVRSTGSSPPTFKSLSAPSDAFRFACHGEWSRQDGEGICGRFCIDGPTDLLRLRGVRIPAESSYRRMEKRDLYPRKFFHKLVILGTETNFKHHLFNLRLKEKAWVAGIAAGAMESVWAGRRAHGVSTDTAQLAVEKAGGHSGRTDVIYHVHSVLMISEGSSHWHQHNKSGAGWPANSRQTIHENTRP